MKKSFELINFYKHEANQACAQFRFILLTKALNEAYS